MKDAAAPLQDATQCGTKAINLGMISSIESQRLVCKESTLKEQTDLMVLRLQQL